MQPPLVEPLSLANRQQLELVVVVRDQCDAGLDRLAVDRQAEGLAVRDRQEEGAQPRKGVPPTPVMFSPVDECRVVTEADVVEEEVARDPAHVDAPFPPAERVERRDRVVAVEPEVAREVVARPERHADDREARSRPRRP